MDESSRSWSSLVERMQTYTPLNVYFQAHCIWALCGLSSLMYKTQPELRESHRSWLEVCRHHCVYTKSSYLSSAEIVVDLSPRAAPPAVCTVPSCQHAAGAFCSSHCRPRLAEVESYEGNDSGGHANNARCKVMDHISSAVANNVVIIESLDAWQVHLPQRNWVTSHYVIGRSISSHILSYTLFFLLLLKALRRILTDVRETASLRTAYFRFYCCFALFLSMI